MYLLQARLYHFRNIVEQTVEFHPQVNLITGENGQGKSNLIEAIHFLSATRSFRSAKLKELKQWEQEEFSVFGTVLSDGIEQELGITYSRGSRKVYVNGDLEKSAVDYVRLFPVVTFAPRDIDLVFGSPSGRRKFIDRYAALLSPPYFSALSYYQKLIRSKAAILKSSYPDRQQLMTLNTLIAEQGALIIRERQLLFQRIFPACQQMYGRFADLDGELQYRLKESYEGDFVQALEEILPQEIARRTTLIGPHLDDVEFLIEGREARSFGSQGQARSIVLALLLSLVEVIRSDLQKPPALLLDDFSSELDFGRMTKFFSLLNESENQVFITGTELSADVFHGDAYRHFSVSEGIISEL